jgi:hypothetical protein
MSDVFISYSRKDTDFVRRLTNSLSRTGRDIWVDWQDIPRGENWLNEIFSGIDNANTFLAVISRHSLISEICNDEIRYARERNKRIFPLIREEIKDELFNQVIGSWYGKSWEQKARENWTEIGHLNWVFFNDDSRFEVEFESLVAALNIDQAHVRAHTNYLVRALEWDRSGRKPSLLLFGDGIVPAEKWLEWAKDKAPSPTPLHEAYIQESRREEDQRQQQVETQARRVRQFRRAAAGLGIMVVLTVLSSIAALLQSRQLRAEQELFGLHVQRITTLAAGGVLLSLDDMNTTPGAFVATATAVAQLGTWQPVLHIFDGVEMVQVPAGCYSETTGHNGVEACFTHPYWIDRYEVTNEQFERFGGTGDGDWPDPQQPRTSINWFEAIEYCDRRDGNVDDLPWEVVHLPNEQEWEYAARGPNSQLYPWKTRDFDRLYVTFTDNRPRGDGTFNVYTEPEAVGTRPLDQSWVGAYDMGSSVQEWIGSAYSYLSAGEHEIPWYPFDPTTPIATDTNTESAYWQEADSNQRVIRGGSFNKDENFLRLTYRAGEYPNDTYSHLGFRCARTVFGEGL